MALDEENLGHRFEDYELDHAQVEGLGDSPVSDHDAPLLNEGPGLQDLSRAKEKGLSGQPTARPKWLSPQANLPVAEEGDDEVPASLLIEDREDTATIMAGKTDMHADAALSFMPPPPSAEEPAPWNPVDMHPAVLPKPRTRKSVRGKFDNALAIIEPRERAMWRWANVENLDNFLKDVYDYYLGNGIWSIILSRALNLLSVKT
jgi:autophagy-related protein 9